ncbi:Mg2+ transporter zinc transport [Pyrenophora seminiperda CCB06]|uniref:Mg2+ transporter zinc transport n=1 Tax=Pyrenophora seminiperda CCB06 TaxID=1302712 RepID=A0A3M7LX74_9PLEO|nr:Mg2+ transporter zinc transport [Pyrenophora seminiperda CCB06]
MANGGSNGNSYAMSPVAEAATVNGIPTQQAYSNGGSISGRSKEEQTKPPIGSWLCAEGEYRKYIQALSASNPGLKNPDPNNKEGPLENGNAKVVLLDLNTSTAAPATGKTRCTKTVFEKPDELKRHFQHVKGTENQTHRRIYIMEGLAPDFIAHVGGHFFMDPTFFQRQERTCPWSNDFTPTSDALPHPSLLDPEKAFYLQYCELRKFNKVLEPNRYYFCKRTRRHVGMTASRKKEKTTIGILRRKVAWWSRTIGSDGWDVVILCDPQLQRLSPDPNEIVDGDNKPRPIEDVENQLKNEPFQEGYVDFLPPVPYDQISTITPHPHTSLLDDIVHYYEQHSGLFSEDEWKLPKTSAIFLKKIVAAHYLQLVDYIKVMLPSLELRLTTAWVEEQDQWKSLQTTSRRCGNYRDDIEDILLSLGYSPEGQRNSSAKGTLGWKDCEKDFQYVYFRLKILKQRADNLMQSMTGLASIAGNRQNLEEAKRVKRLNLLALFFIPLAYTSSLFSMQDSYAPNQKHFWVYWVSALGVAAFTAAVMWGLDKSLDDEAQWTWDLLGNFKFWGNGENKSEPGMNRKKSIGFYDARRR